MVATLAGSASVSVTGQGRGGTLALSSVSQLMVLVLHTSLHFLPQSRTSVGQDDTVFSNNNPVIARHSSDYNVELQLQLHSVREVLLSSCLS